MSYKFKVDDKVKVIADNPISDDDESRHEIPLGTITTIKEIQTFFEKAPYHLNYGSDSSYFYGNVTEDEIELVEEFIMENMEAGKWYMAREKGKGLFRPHICLKAFRTGNEKLLRTPSRVTKKDDGTLERHSPSPYHYDYETEIIREMAENEVYEWYNT